MRTTNQHFSNNRETSIEHLQEHYFHFDAKRATGALTTGRQGLRGAEARCIRKIDYLLVAMPAKVL